MSLRARAVRCVLLPLGIGAAACACSACSDDALAPATTGSTTSATSSSSSTSTITPSTSSSSTSGDGGDEPCGDAWAGWVRWKGFGGTCRICVPGSKEAMPEPIAWQPCDPKSGMTTGCQEMKVTWPGSPADISGVVSGSIEGGSLVLDITRNSLGNGLARPYQMRVIAQADGPVLQAMAVTGAKVNDCVVAPGSFVGLHQGKAIARVQDVNPTLGFHETIIGGALDAVPSVLTDFPVSDGHAPAAAASIWGTYDSYEIKLAKWGEPLVTVLNGGQVGGKQQAFLFPYDSLAIWQSHVGVASDLMAWTPTRGVYPFVAFGNDTSKEASGFGTDGKFMVWTQSEGRNYANDTFAKRDVMAAPYNEDPAKLAPVRLRSWPSQYSITTPWIVGCGYAALSIVPGRTLIVRIADGVSWETPTPGCTGPNFTDDWCFEHPYAITCEEVFLRGGYINLARIKLDALGPGTPPD